ncbi:MAG TPA: FecR domain-containing protein [Prolixibacteraceae bacterium]|nr:FecR domain-containing protein [Prolixibacteraceae bacterium]
MREWDQTIFEELISNTRFVAWVKGEDDSKSEYWNAWKTNHPLSVIEFQEAVRITQELRFRGTDVKKTDIQYLWIKTTEKINQLKPISGFRNFIFQATRVAAILLLPVMLVSVWLFYGQHNLAQKYAQLLQDKYEQNITVVAPIGARITVDLPDGSKAWLNSGSEISYPVVFNTSERRVNLSGEAYFKIQKSETPFFVSNLGPEIKVYGTEFNVNSYADEDLVTVALTEGKVSLDLNGEEEFLVPGQVSVFDKQRKNITIENTDVNTYSSWREGKYIFRETPLSAILRILQRQHNVNIQLMNPELGNYRYNATINNESLEQILQLLSLSAPIKYNYIHRELSPDGSWKPDKIEISADKTRIIKN